MVPRAADRSESVIPVSYTHLDVYKRQESFLTSEDNAFLAKIREAVRNTLDEATFEQTIERLREAIDARINTNDIPAVVNHAGNEFGITDSEQSGVLQHLLEQEDMSLYGCLLYTSTLRMRYAPSRSAARSLPRLQTCTCANRLFLKGVNQWKTSITARLP